MLLLVRAERTLVPAVPDYTMTVMMMMMQERPWMQTQGFVGNFVVDRVRTSLNHFQNANCIAILHCGHVRGLLHNLGAYSRMVVPAHGFPEATLNVLGDDLGRAFILQLQAVKC